MTGKKAAFLDRDGVLNKSLVINGKPQAPRRLEDFHIYPEAKNALERLKDNGFLTIVVTNQKDVGLGLVDEDVVRAMHDKLRAELPLDDIRICTCADDCPCYKPEPGMLLDARDEWGLHLPSSFMIGDRWRDIGAGQRAGCRTVLIERGWPEDNPFVPDWTVSNLAEAVSAVLKASPVDSGADSIAP